MRFCCGESELPRNVGVWFNGERVQPRTVVEADDETGLLVQVQRNADGSIVWGPTHDLVYVERVGRVEFRKIDDE